MSILCFTSAYDTNSVENTQFLHFIQIYNLKEGLKNWGNNLNSIFKYKLAHRVGQIVFVSPHTIKFGQHYTCSFNFYLKLLIEKFTYICCSVILGKNETQIKYMICLQERFGKHR